LDFHLYYITRYGLRPSKVLFSPGTRGAMPRAEAGRPISRTTRGTPIRCRNQKVARCFLFRFFEISQFKRSALPNGPKVVSGGNCAARRLARSIRRKREIVARRLQRNVPDMDRSFHLIAGRSP
jgi:NAD+ synthase (glutamine-hydrolysing)